MVTTIEAEALFEQARYPACEAFDVERLAQGKIEVVDLSHGHPRRSSQGRDPRQWQITMCGRYGYYPGEFRDIRISYRDFIDPPDFRQRFNIAPTQDAPIIVPSETGNTLKMFRWGLIPNWSKDGGVVHMHINARAETIAEKPTFKPLIGRRHCLVLANGFYEWRKDGKQRFPLHFKLKSGDSGR